MNQSASEKFRWMSFWCSICIAFLHLSASINPETTPQISYYQNLAVPAMSYFFFSSAYFRYRNFDRSDYLPKLKKRIKSLLIPYICWNIIGYIVCVAMDFVPFSFSGLVKMFIFVYIPGIELVHEPIIGALWFVIRLLTYEIALPFFYEIIKKKYRFYICIAVIIPLVCILHVNYYSFLYWTPVYLAGAFLAFHYKEKLEQRLDTSKYSTGLKLLGTILSIGLYLGYAWGVRALNVSYDMERYLAVPVLLLCMYLFSFYPKTGWIVTHTPFYLYCSHIPIRLLLTGVFMSWFSWISSPFVFANVLMIGMILFAWATEWVLYKLCPGVWKLLIGGR